MSADAASIPCPVCLHTGVFKSAQSLKDRLIFVSTNKIVCPICQEEVTGLDKLTIHLFTHVNNMICNKEKRHKQPANVVRKDENKTNTEKRKKPKNSKNKPTAAVHCAPVKFVKIYPKLPTVSPLPTLHNHKVKNNSSLNLTPTNTESSQTQNMKCNLCGVQFINEGILKMHNSIIHNYEEKSDTITTYDCHLCSKSFKMRGSLMVHLRVAHFGFTQKNKIENDCKNKNEDAKRRSSGDEKQIECLRNDGKQWQCDVCSKFFTTKYFLKKHKRLHTGETPYACLQCNKTFTFQQSYHKHLLYHNDDKPHTCSFCGRAFKELSTLHNHQRIHTGEKPFACESCGKCFRQRVSYLVHRRIHTGAMPYKCTACDKSFRYKVSQRTHKCQAQPPGTVVRKSTELIEKLKKKNDTGDKEMKVNEQQATNFHEVSEDNAELVRTGAQLSLEDMESENFSIISDNVLRSSNVKNDTANIETTNDDSSGTEKLYSNLEALIDSIPIVDKNIPSPSDILKNLCLSNDEDYLGILQE